jgi:hypothetical protein
MNLSQIIEALPLQVYVRRGELVIHFSTPADLVSRVPETSAVLSVWSVKVMLRDPMGKRIVSGAARTAA